MNSYLFFQEKCAQYWPTTAEQQMSFTDTGFVVRLLSEEDHSYFTIRVLKLQNIKVRSSLYKRKISICDVFSMT